MKASVLIPYFQGRREQLKRTLWLLMRQTYDDYDVWILDDGSDEKIDILCSKSVPLSYSRSMINYVKLRDAGANPRGCNVAWNVGYRMCRGEFVILTHPEYMPPLDAIERMIHQYDGSARLEPTAYALPSRAMGTLDQLDWKNDLDVLQTVPDFWTFKTPWGWTNFEAKEWCHHFAFTGQTREGWDIFDFIPDTSEFKMNDSWIVGLEVKGGRPPKNAGFAVYHQHHERLSEWPFPERSVRHRRHLENN